MTKTVSYVNMVEQLQCPGCVNGGSTDCGAFKQGTHGQCTSHAPGTTLLGAGTLALGFPKGFCRLGTEIDPRDRVPPFDAVIPTWELANGVKLELYENAAGWDHLNVAVAVAPWRDKAVVFTWSPRVDKLYLTINDPKEIPPRLVQLPADTIAPEPYPARKVKIGIKRFAVRFWKDGDRPTYGDDVRAVWAMREGDLLFVRACRPATAERWVDVVADARHKELVPQAISVKDFIDEID